jgi:hypothetical protein
VPERSSTPLESPELVGDPISSDGACAGREAVDGPADVGGADRGNSVPSPLPVLPVLPTAPPRPMEPVDLSASQLDVERADGEGRGGWGTLVFSREANGWLVSFLVHCSLLLILGLIATAAGPGAAGTNLIAHMSGREPSEELDWEISSPVSRPAVAEPGQIEQEAALPEVFLSTDVLFEPDRSLGTGIGLQPSAALRLFPHADAPVGGGLEGRSAQGRARLLADGDDGTPDSESAVDRGLRWLSSFQREDGSWNFDHNKGRNSGFCRNPGTVASTTGATAIALAPFLGRGYTHMEGEYQDTVHKGLYYLKSRALVTPNGVDLQEGTMYAQGLAAIVLSEGYAMTRDPGLKEVAQGALDFIEYAQDKKGGGWRYTPGEPGDTTVTGWQLMALKSGQMANLHIHSPNFYLACNFLNSVECEDGARYGYVNTNPRKTTTAIGLLLRMYTGWRRSNPGLGIGVGYLSEWGPSEDNMYYNYYATQVMRHWGGPEWKRWNPEMRDYLIATQSNHGHEAGSWYFSGGHGESGGRLYNTAMAVMTLEVYYRYMPLYRQKAFEE